MNDLPQRFRNKKSRNKVNDNDNPHRSSLCLFGFTISTVGPSVYITPLRQVELLTFQYYLLTTQHFFGRYLTQSIYSTIYRNTREKKLVLTNGTSALHADEHTGFTGI